VRIENVQGEVCPRCNGKGRHVIGPIHCPAMAICKLCTAPAVQGEPVAWVTADTVDGQTVNGRPRRIWWENNEGVGMPIYASPAAHLKGGE